MKVKTKLLYVFAIAIFALCFVSCKKSTPPTVKIYDNISTSYTSANVTGEVTDEGSSSVIDRGFVYGKQGESRQDTVYCGSGAGEFPTRLTGLEPNTTYNCFAFARNEGGIGTSGKVTFTTRDHDLPIATTFVVENVGTATASCGGEVTDDGGANITERGVCWSKNHNPTISGSHASAGSGLGEFSCNMTNLSANTTYYVRAYAKNSKGVGYGEEKHFTTLDFDLPEVTTAAVTDITQTSAKCGGVVTNDGGTTVTERGVCWSTSHNPTISGGHANSGTGVGTFTSDISGLSAHTTYYVRAYATNSKGTAYGDEVAFNTSANLPMVSTGSVTNITTTSATGSGTVISDGGSPVTERGLCWSTNHNPTIGGTHVAAGNGTGEFSATMTHLSPNTTYYVRAYATNGVSTSYGDEVPFTTPSLSVPGVTTASVTNIANTTATGGGNVINNGGAQVTERGICWSTSHNPTINGNHASSGTGTGNYTVNMTNLTPNTTYYVRAYAINSQGTGYGEEVNFKTSQTPTYTISVSANPTNGGTVTGGGTYQQGQSCIVSATAATGYNFLKWTENGQQVSTSANYTFNVTGNRTLVAQFQTKSYTISASANPSNGGTVSGGGTYNHGQSCTLTASPATGYTFVKWTKNGTQVSTNASYTFTVTGSASYVAHFQANSYTISVSANPSNGGTVSGSGTYTYGQSCTVHASANSGYTFQKWTVNGSQVSTNANYTFTVTSNRNLVAHFTYNPQAPTGAINGLFSVSATQQVWFSQGNLQYKASTNTWRFATNQWDYVGEANSNISSSYSGWIDLFGWGTSGYNHGAVCYQPWSISQNDNYYFAYGNENQNLYDQSGLADWGYNAINNAGNTTNTWQALRHEEWAYVFNTRSTSSGIRYAKAQVAGVNGVILLPDNWSSNYYPLNSTNQSGTSYSSNVISSSTWTSSLEVHGAVFLPAAGWRHGLSLANIGTGGFYWSASRALGGVYPYAYLINFYDGFLYIDSIHNRSFGRSVRLVCPAQ
ncbi:MAG: hypothetical protein IKZ55_11240 [Bacteroidales bacterium]|nr:hypothetical protein [Bacteroidales bacterium]